MSHTYGLNRYGVPFTSNMIKEGYAWYENDIMDNPLSPDYNRFDIKYEGASGIQEFYMYLPAGIKENVSIQYMFDYMKSTSSRKTDVFYPKDDLIFDEFGICDLKIRTRHPITKRCMETSVWLYNEKTIISVIQDSGHLVKNNNTVAYLTYTDAMIDFSNSAPVIVNEVIKPISNQDKILLFLKGKNSTIS